MRRGAAGPNLRDLLREVPPSDFPLKKAWQRVVRSLRERRRRTGSESRLGSWADVERALGSVPLHDDPSRLTELKSALRTALRDPDDLGDAAADVDRLVSSLLPAVASGAVVVEVDGWPADFDAADRQRLLRTDEPPPLTLDAERAAALLREFDGFVLAGSRLRARARVKDGEVLPPVPRRLRAKPLRRDRDGPWLPYTDDVGKRSLTPRELAERQAARLSGETSVVDGFCGVGGNSIALALAGFEVDAVEIDPARLALARANAAALGVTDRITFHLGDLLEVLPGLPLDSALFLDPPWSAIDVTRLPLPRARTVMLKLPRDFDVALLPGAEWRTFYEFGAREDDRSVVRMLTVVRPRS